MMHRYDDGETEWIDRTKEKIEFVDAASQSSCVRATPQKITSSSVVTPQKAASIATPQKTSTPTPQKTSSPTPQKKTSTPSRKRANSEDAYIPKEEESSDEPIPMDVESSEDEPILSTFLPSLPP